MSDLAEEIAEALCVEEHDTLENWLAGPVKVEVIRRVLAGRETAGYLVVAPDGTKSLWEELYVASEDMEVRRLIDAGGPSDG